MGQALATANICSVCGEGLARSVKTMELCSPVSPDAHYHESQPYGGGGSLPTCCRCMKSQGKYECIDGKAVRRGGYADEGSFG